MPRKGVSVLIKNWYSTVKASTTRDGGVGREIDVIFLKRNKIHAEQKKLGNFIDTRVVTIKAGEGGKGAISFEASSSGDVSRARPDGGTGGNGGSVYIVASPMLPKNLCFIKKSLLAENGARGTGNKCNGRNGSDLVIKVPTGTMVYALDDSSDKSSAPINERRSAKLSKNNDKRHNRLIVNNNKPYGSDAESENEIDVNDINTRYRLVCDMDGSAADQKVLLEKGGRGARGNCGQWMEMDPELMDGEVTFAKKYVMMLKMVADCGFVGFPNAGKSSLLNALTNAKSLVAAYPFTTINPHLGVVEYPLDAFQIFIADIPGIIEDAHKDKGLGIDFLKHVSRSRVLLYVLDMSGQDGRDPIHDYTTLRNELFHFDQTLLNRPSIIIANKTDLPNAQKNIRRLNAIAKSEIIEYSTINNTNLDKLKMLIRKYVECE